MMETYHGYVRTPADAIKLFEACRLGLLPRVQRRLSEKERQSIRSGSVFVWDEREAGMRRWTDGKSWSASRVSGSFLTYREMEGKRGSGFGGNSRRSQGKTPETGQRHSDEDPDGEPEGYRYKADGLMKQSFSITTSQGQHLHLISYYSRPHPGAPDLPQPSTDPQLRHIIPAKGMYPESSLHDTNPPVDSPSPAFTRGPMQSYVTTAGPPEHPPYGYAWGPPPPGAWHPGAWPPSPSATPPWTQTTAPRPEVKQPSPHLQHQSRPAPPPIHHSPHHPAYAPVSHPAHQAPPPQSQPQVPPPRLPLPPTTSATREPPAYSKSPRPYEPERLPAPQSGRPPHLVLNPASLSPRSKQLQDIAGQAAQAVMIDPRLTATSARNPQGPLPAMSSGGPGLTPPRTHSASPPRSFETSNPVNKSSLSALLHPTPSNSEPNSANPASSNSANSSPRALMTGTAGPQGPSGKDAFNADARALRSLDRKFCI